MNAEIRYYLHVFRLRLPLFLLVAAALTAAGVATAIRLPPVYSASGVMLVEAPQIPPSLAESTVAIGAREQLTIVEQRLTTRSNLLEIARSYNVFEDIAELSPHDIVERMRASTEIEGSEPETPRTSRREEGGMIITVSFRARTGEIAAAVVNEYLTRILSENADQRQERAEGTLEFFQQEAERLSAELKARNDAILAYQKSNVDALPETFNFRLSSHQRLNERLSELSRELSLLEQQRTRLMALRGRGLSTQDLVSSSEPATQSQAELAELKLALVNARAVYAEDSARIQLLESRIAALEEQVAQEANRFGPEGETMDLVSIQIIEVDASIDALEEQIAELEEQAAVLEQTLQEIPLNAITLQRLEREYASVERQYNFAVERLSAAAVGERIEVLSKGERVSIIEPALPPSAPSEPNRPVIALAGAGAGILLGIGLIVLLEILDKSVRRPLDLSRELGVTPLATIGYITTPGQRMRRRALWGATALVVLGAISGVLYYAHNEVMPLDLAAIRIAQGLGL